MTTRYLSWIYKRWSANLQNLWFEIENVESIIRDLKQSDYLGKQQKQFLQTCEPCLEDAKKMFLVFFPRELYIWQKIFFILQHQLLVVPKEELGTCWNQLERRLKKNEEISGNQLWKRKVTNEINKLIKEHKLGNEEDLDLRYRMKRIRKSLDDQVIVELWRSVQIRRYTRAFLFLGIVLTCSLFFIIRDYQYYWVHDGRCLNYVICNIECGDCHIMSMMLAGALGSVISALAPGQKMVKAGIPFSMTIWWVRPFIGALAGLFLHLAIVEYQFLDMEAGKALTTAIVLGFSERALFGLLSGFAWEPDKSIERKFN